jgi:hypothetical protein
MVEQRPFKPLVGGSSPPAPTNVFLGFIPQHSAVLAFTQLRTPEILFHTPDSFRHILVHSHLGVTFTDIFMAEKSYCLKEIKLSELIISKLRDREDSNLNGIFTHTETQSNRRTRSLQIPLFIFNGHEFYSFQKLEIFDYFNAK